MEPTSKEILDNKKWLYFKLYKDPHSEMAIELKNKDAIKNEFVSDILKNKNLIWDYEVMNTFNVMRDLGSRYGSKNEDQTLRFVRYWDAGCKYILSILTMPGNWIVDVDVWGIPHLINNSIGAWLRHKPSDVCSKCGGQMYINTTGGVQFRFSEEADIKTPLFALVCKNCSSGDPANMNI